MKPCIYTSKKRYEDLELYQRMIECFASAALVKGKYLDLMNFSKDEFKQVIDPIIVERIFHPEHGYTSPDGSLELSMLIKELERLRLIKNTGLSTKQADKIVSQLACGLGNGVTGVISGIFWAISKIKASHKNEVITFRPSYPVFESLAKQNNFKIKPVLTKRENGFLPSFEEIKKNCSSKTAAIALVYPNNPSFTTFQDKKILKRIVEFCQKNKIFLIADNIYQEMMFNGKKHIEIFSLVNKPDYIIKLFGPSKDRPFFTGHRLGYYIGDPKIGEAYFDYCASNFICLGTFAKNIFSLDLLFRILLYKKSKDLNQEDVKLLMPFLRGWMQNIDTKEIFGEIKKSKAFQTYKSSVEYNNEKLKSNLKELTKLINKSSVFEDFVNDNSGNAIFVKVNPKYYSGNDLTFYNDVLVNKKIALYPGNIFGMPIKNGSLWFRFTIIHTSKREIIKMLKEIEDCLIKRDTPPKINRF